MAHFYLVQYADYYRHILVHLLLINILVSATNARFWVFENKKLFLCVKCWKINIQKCFKWLKESWYELVTSWSRIRIIFIRIRNTGFFRHVWFLMMRSGDILSEPFLCGESGFNLLSTKLFAKIFNIFIEYLPMFAVIVRVTLYL